MKTEDIVDLGLPSGTRWMRCNIGSETEEGCGRYFQFGDIIGRTDPAASPCVWSTCPGNGGSDDKDEDSLIKWDKANINEEVLIVESDAAWVATEGVAHIPTVEQFEELANGTIRNWEDVNSVIGMRFTSKVNGNSIFIPACGYCNGNAVYNVGDYGCVWASSFYYSGFIVKDFFFDANGIEVGDETNRRYGENVRGVVEKDVQLFDK